MEKLIELLNEYIEENKPKTNLVKEITDDGYFVNNWNDGDGFLCETIMSKRFGFIKWLVDNDKILETEVRPIQIYDYEGKYCDDEFGYSWFNQGLYYRVIMELAISDTPIEDLISYLK